MTEVTTGPPSRRYRRGLGVVLVLVVLLLILLGVLGLHRAIFTAAVIEDAAASQRGALALTLAESALDELQRAVRLAVNDPAHPAYGQFREIITVDPAKGFDIALGADPVPLTRQLASRHPYAPNPFQIAVPPPRVLFRKLIESATRGYNEIYGSLSYTVTVVESREQPLVERTLEATQDFKMVALVVPPPFDQIALLLVDPEGLLGGAEVNRTAERLGSIRDFYVRRFETALTQTTDSQAVAELTEIKKYFESIPSYMAGRAIADYPPEVVHAFEFPMTAFGRAEYMDSHPVTGQEIDLAPDLLRWRSEVERLDQECRSLLQSLQGQTTAPPPGALERLNQSLKKLAETLYEHQQRINRWQTIFGEVVGAPYRRIQEELARLGRESLEKKAFFQISEAESDGRIDLAYQRLRAELKARTGTDRLNGVLTVDNPGSVLDLTGQSIEGRLIVVTSGGVKVGDTRSVGDSDHIIVICHGELVIEGDVQGGLAAMDRYRFRGPATIDGALILAKPVSGTLAGLTVKRDAKLSAARQGGQYDPKAYYVGVAPRLSSQVLRR